jgi:hypothetical protein
MQNSNHCNHDEAVGSSAWLGRDRPQLKMSPSVWDALAVGNPSKYKSVGRN